MAVNPISAYLEEYDKKAIGDVYIITERFISCKNIHIIRTIKAL